MSFTFTTNSDYTETARSGELVKPGWYEAVVLEAVEKYSKMGSPMIELKLGIDVGRTLPFELKSWLVLSTKAAWKIEQFLAATGKKFKKGEQVTIDAPELEGKRLCLTVCNRRTDKGGLWPDILDFRAREFCPRLGAMTPEEMTAHDLDEDGVRINRARELANEMRREDSLPAKTTPAPIPHEDDDDIPF